MATQVGRPRASDKKTSGDVRGDIVLAAGKLFRTKGFAGTSLREIGAEAGLRKASLYYYFEGKNDILASMIREVMDPPLAIVAKFKKNQASPAAKLWAYLYFDSRQLCEAPFDYSWFLTVSETRTPAFKFFWDDRKKLLKWIGDVIALGVKEGEFSDVDVKMAARAAFSLDEFAVNWSADSGRKPEDAARFVADFALLSLLNERVTLETARKTGRGLLD
jgi:AcrR family transcriptional regulator